MGLYSSSQFLGAFVGGVAGGWLLGGFGTSGVFAGCVLMALLWLMVAAGMRAPEPDQHRQGRIADNKVTLK